MGNMTGYGPGMVSFRGAQRNSKDKFRDALIIQAALTAGCTRLFSEDLRHGFEIDRLTVEDPFL